MWQGAEKEKIYEQKIVHKINSEGGYVARMDTVWGVLVHTIWSASAPSSAVAANVVRNDERERTIVGLTDVGLRWWRDHRLVRPRRSDTAQSLHII